MHCRRFLLFVLAFLAISFYSSAQEVISVDSPTLDQHVAHRVGCLYPPIFKAANSFGTIVLHVQVGVTGKIESIKIVSGSPILRQAAIDCVKQWTFRPFEKNGKPVAASGQVSVVLGWGGDESASAAIQSQLEPWLGYWEFSECRRSVDGSSGNCVRYKLSILSGGDKAIVDIDVNGYKSMSRFRCDGILTENSIKIVYLHSREKAVSDGFNAGDMLFELSSQNGKVITAWKKMQPELDENKPEGVHFVKVK